MHSNQSLQSPPLPKHRAPAVGLLLSRACHVVSFFATCCFPAPLMFFSVFLPSYYRFQPISSSYSLLHFFPSIVAHPSPSASFSSGPCCWLSHLQRKSTRLIAVSLLINFSCPLPWLKENCPRQYSGCLAVSNESSLGIIPPTLYPITAQCLHHVKEAPSLFLQSNVLNLHTERTERYIGTY